MSIRNCINKDIVLSPKDIKNLKKIYKNHRIRLEHIEFDVKSIMINEGVTKEKAINKILNIYYRCI